MELIERTDPRFRSIPLFRCAYVWRDLFDRAKSRALDSDCFVVPDENGYTGAVVAYAESELMMFVKKEFRKFKVSPVQHDEDGVYIAHVEPRVLGWPLLNP